MAFLRAVLLLSAGLLAFLPLHADAQFRVEPLGGQVSAAVTVEKPFLVQDGFAFSTSLVRVHAQRWLKEDVRLGATLGIAHARTGSGRSDYRISNPVFGVWFGPATGTSVQVAMGLPFSRQLGDGASAGAVASVVDSERPELYLSETLSIALAIRRTWSLSGGWEVGAQGGLALITPESRDQDLFGRYAAFASLPLGPVVVGGELSGSARFTLEDANLGQRTLHHLTFFVGAPGLGEEGHVFLRLPADNGTQGGIDAVVGVSVRF